MKLIDLIKYCVFIAGQKKPITTGYGIYKEKEILKILHNKDFNTDNLKPGYGYRLDERVIEYPWLFSRLPTTGGNLLDAGSALNLKYILEQDGLSSSKNIFISTLFPEELCFWKDKICYVYEDFRNSCFRDNYFDWVVSLSVIEHIGMDNTKFYTNDTLKKENQKYSFLSVINELNRILKPGGTLFLTVPFGKYHNHGWLQVFDSKMLDQLLETFSPSSFVENHFRYATGGWHISSREESSECTYFDYYENKKYDEDFAAAARGIACLELVK